MSGFGEIYDIGIFVEKFFKLYDKDSDEEISFEEVVQRCEKEKIEKPAFYANSLFKQMDKNGDEKITPKEVRAFKFSQSAMAASLEAELKGMMRVYDTNSNGKITFQEIQDYYSAMGHPDPKRLATGFFSLYDTDKSGSITVSELRDFMVQMKFDQNNSVSRAGSKRS